MRAAFVTAYGGPRVLEIRETAVPRLEPRQVLVKVRAFGLNFADIFSRLGVYPNNPKAPFIPGLECSGDIVAVGPEAQLFNGRERVMGYSRNGSHAEYVAVDERYVARMPSSMTTNEAYIIATNCLCRISVDIGALEQQYQPSVGRWPAR